MLDQIDQLSFGISLQSVDAEKKNTTDRFMAQNQKSNHRKRERYNSCKVQRVS